MFDTYMCMYVCALLYCAVGLKKLTNLPLRNKEKHHVIRLFSSRPVPQNSIYDDFFLMLVGPLYSYMDMHTVYCLLKGNV